MSRFNQKDQLAFATLSGDFNPAHLDPNYARRLIWGGASVHGIHQVFFGINYWLKSKNKKYIFQKFNAKFLKPLLVTSKFNIEVTELEKSVEIRLISSNIVTTRINFSYKTVSHLYNENFPNRTFVESLPSQLGIENIDSLERFEEVCFDQTLLLKLFPNIFYHFCHIQIGVALSTTRIVGMKCPGLNSIFSELALGFTGQPNRDILSVLYKVDRIHKIFKRIDFKFSFPQMTGKIKTFLRPIPYSQPTIESLSDLIKEKQLHGEKVLVIGGSRGIGEVTLKLLALGGAEVFFTYNKGKIDADRIVGELKQHDLQVSYFKYDVLKKGQQIKDTFTHLYYFATPFIFTGQKDKFQFESFSTFSEFYLKGFFDIVQQLCDKGLEKVFYPSTIAISDCVNGMWEYSAAKAAGEQLCKSLEKRYKHLTIHRPRLPRILTDQTVSVMTSQGEQSELEMIKYLKAMHGALN